MQDLLTHGVFKPSAVQNHLQACSYGQFPTMLWQEELTTSSSQWGTSSSQRPCTLGVPRPTGRWRWCRQPRRPQSTSRLCFHHRGVAPRIWPLLQWRRTAASRWKVVRTGPQTAAPHTGQTSVSPRSPCCGSSKKKKKGDGRGGCGSELSPCPSQGWAGLRPVCIVCLHQHFPHTTAPALRSPNCLHCTRHCVPRWDGVCLARCSL